jgi:hypothetical protein
LGPIFEMMAGRPVDERERCEAGRAFRVRTHLAGAMRLRGYIRLIYALSLIVCLIVHRADCGRRRRRGSAGDVFDDDDDDSDRGDISRGSNDEDDDVTIDRNTHKANKMYSKSKGGSVSSSNGKKQSEPEQVTIPPALKSLFTPSPSKPINEMSGKVLSQ